MWVCVYVHLRCHECACAGVQLRFSTYVRVGINQLPAWERLEEMPLHPRVLWQMTPASCVWVALLRSLHAAFRTYRFIKVDGWEVVFNSMPRRTFYHHVSMLAKCGISRADLQNSVGTGNVVPFTRYIGVDFDKQFPDGITEESIIKPFAFQIKQIENVLKKAF